MGIDNQQRRQPSKSATTLLQGTPKLGKAAVLLGASVLASGCTMTPHVPRDPPPKDDATQFATESAYVGLRDKDGFAVPQAKGLYEKSTGASREETEEKSSQAAFKLGLSEITFGPHPPFSDGAPGPHLRDEQSVPSNAQSPPPTAPQYWGLKKTIFVGEGYLYKADFVADGNEVVALSTDSGTLYHFDVATGKPLGKVKLPNYQQFDRADFEVVAELAERPQLLINQETGSSILDLKSGKFDPLDGIAAGDGIERTWIHGLYGTSFRRIDPQSGELSLYWLTGERSLFATCAERPDDWDLSRDGKWLAIYYFPSNTTQLLDLEKRSVVAEYENPQWGANVALSPDKSMIALGGEKLSLIRTVDSSVIGEDTSFKNNISNIEFSPQGDLLLVAAFDGKVRSYALGKDPKSLTKLPIPQELAHKYMTNVYGIGFTQDGRRLVTSSGDQTLKIWAR